MLDKRFPKEYDATGQLMFFFSCQSCELMMIPLCVYGLFCIRLHDFTLLLKMRLILFRDLVIVLNGTFCHQRVILFSNFRKMLYKVDKALSIVKEVSNSVSRLVLRIFCCILFNIRIRAIVFLLLVIDLLLYREILLVSHLTGAYISPTRLL